MYIPEPFYRCYSCQQREQHDGHVCSHDLSCSILSCTESRARSIPRTGLKRMRWMLLLIIYIFNHTIPCLMIEVPQENLAKEPTNVKKGMEWGPQTYLEIFPTLMVENFRFISRFFFLIFFNVNYLFFISTLWIYRRNQFIRQGIVWLKDLKGELGP